MGPVPDQREEYPVHMPEEGKRKRVGKKQLDPYYECRTYDKNGQLMKIELRPPIYGGSEYQKILYSKVFYSRVRGDDERTGR